MNAQITFKHANQIAQEAADKIGMPMTVYKTKDTYGWAHTNALSNNLRGAQVAVTWLNSNWFN